MIEITLDNGKVLHVEKLPLGKYADLLKAFQELPKHVGEFKSFGSMTNDQFIQIIPQLLGSCMPDIIRVIEIATELTPDEINALGLNEVIDIVTAIYQVNNYQAVFDKLKKVIAQPKKQEVQIPENTTQSA